MAIGVPAISQGVAPGGGLNDQLVDGTCGAGYGLAGSAEDGDVVRAGCTGLLGTSGDVAPRGDGVESAGGDAPGVGGHWVVRLRRCRDVPELWGDWQVGFCWFG